tara:strand:- start:446 stop:916 length:471 start_codon:yes stop_codon:yes gene_type:complete
MDARTEFGQLVQQVASFVGERDLDAGLAADLNDAFGYGSEMHDTFGRLILAGESEVWLLSREASNINFGRPVKPGREAGQFSVDVVHVAKIRGPHHIHASGEIGVMFPLEGTPVLDSGRDAWYVYTPASDYHPTVSGGTAHVLYFLPDGAIEFTGR